MNAMHQHFGRGIQQGNLCMSLLVFWGACIVTYVVTKCCFKPDFQSPAFLAIERLWTIFFVSRAAWYAGIAEGRYPTGVQLGKRSLAWSNESLKKLISEVSNQSSAGFDTS